MSRRWFVLTCLLVPISGPGGRAVAQAQEPPVIKADSKPQQTTVHSADEQRETLSPLHSFLGIDAKTGEFLSEAEKQQRKERWAKQTAPKTEAGDQPVASAPGGSSPDQITSVPDDLEPVRQEAEVAVQRFSEAVKALNDGELTPLSHLLDSGLRDGSYQKLQKWISLAAGLVFLIPALVLLISGMAERFLAGDNELVDDIDRRYQRGRFRRQMIRAALFLVLAGLAPLGIWYATWWENPAWFSAYAGTVLLLIVAAAALGRANRESAKWYGQATLREIRKGQFELRQEIEHLRRSMPGHRPSLGN